MIPRWLLLLVLIFSTSKAQLRPIFDTSAPLQNDDVVPKHMEPSPNERRDSQILGSRSKTPLDDLPFCRGNSRICQFLSCSAENFKKDPTFGNLQLGAQILSDKKLRQAVSSNPEAIDAVCREQGMGADECKVFSKGFQLIDRFITTIEEPKEEAAKTLQADPIPIPIARDNEVVDDVDYPASFPAASNQADNSKGSQTWSSHPSQPQNDAQMFEVRNDLVASLTPPPFAVLPPLFLPPKIVPIAPPSPPTAPPLAFPTVPSLILPSFKLPELDKGLFFPADKYTFGPPGKNEIIRLKRSNEEEDFDEMEEEKTRIKRDYYDELANKAETSPKPVRNSKNAKESEDYYGSLDDDVPTKPLSPNPLRDCMNLLG